MSPFLFHSVVPHCFRRHFPVDFKSHSSHDIVLLCCHCHHRVAPAYAALRTEMLKECQVPPAQPLLAQVHVRRAVAHSKTLLKSARMPIDKRASLSSEICQLLQVDPNSELSPDELRAIATEAHPTVSALLAADEPPPCPEAAVVALHAHNLSAFVQRWRALFLSELGSRFLSSHWSVRHEDKE